MIWLVIILALVIGGIVGLFTRNLRKALRVGLIILVTGIILSLLIVYSGLMGG